MEYNTEDIKELLYEKLAGTISQQDDLIVEQAIASDAEVNNLWIELTVKMNSLESKAFSSKLDVEDSWNKVQQQIEPAKIMRLRPRHLTILSTAAVFLLAIPAIWFFLSKDAIPPRPDISQLKHVYLVPDKGKAIDLSYNRAVMIGNVKLKAAHNQLSYTSKSGKGWATLHVPAAKDYKIVLPDGTQVWLNSASSLRFPYQFDSKVREVYLTGEAYFQVARDTKHKFIVHTDFADIQVHGTTFNLNAYDKTSFAASLLEGAVSVASGDQLVKLVPGQGVKLLRESLIKGEFDAQEVLSWRKGIYVFHNKSLGDISQLLARLYDVQIVWKTAGIAEQTFTGEIDKSLPIAVVISNLQLSSGVKAEFNKGILTFR